MYSLTLFDYMSIYFRAVQPRMCINFASLHSYVSIFSIIKIFMTAQYFTKGMQQELVNHPHIIEYVSLLQNSIAISIFITFFLLRVYFLLIYSQKWNLSVKNVNILRAASTFHQLYSQSISSSFFSHGQCLSGNNAIL